MDIYTTLRLSGAMHTRSHFVYTGGDHGDAYVNLRVLNDAKNRSRLQKLSYALFKRVIRNANIDPEKKIVVVGPDTLGAIMAELIAEQCNQNHMTNVTHSALKKTLSGNIEQFIWGNRGGLRLLKNAQVIWIDDLMNAGSTLQKTRHLIETFSKIDAVATIADRSGFSSQDLNVPYFESLIQFTLNRYPENACPLCEAKKPIVMSLGHGEQFQKTNPDYPGGFIKI